MLALQRLADQKFKLVLSYKVKSRFKASLGYMRHPSRKNKNKIREQKTWVKQLKQAQETDWPHLPCCQETVFMEL